jgi:alpha-aminoadipate/glutamate carrier protein LysW
MNNCPECDAQVNVPPAPRAGEILVCGECQAELEIVAINPIELALAPDVEEDWGE